MGKELFVTIESAVSIQGTLTIPAHDAATYPAILLIAGTGKGDRDGNVRGLPLRLYKDLADYFTSLGFATLRYDKRGVNKSEGDYYETGVTDLIDDGVACVRFLKEHPQIDPKRIVIVGHSEGALLAPAIYVRESVANLILLSGAAEPSKTLLPKQMKMVVKELEAASGFKGWLYRFLKLPQRIQKQNEAQMEKIQQSSKPALRIKGVKVNAKWIREQFQYNVVEYLERVTCPVLAITGDRDVQVPPEQAREIAEYVAGEAEWHIIPNMNHILREVEKNHTMLGLMKEYKGLVNKGIQEELLNVMKEWLVKYNLPFKS
ncbi:alpha/beta fold hydrolase [Bacillus cereus]